MEKYLKIKFKSPEMSEEFKVLAYMKKQKTKTFFMYDHPNQDDDGVTKCRLEYDSGVLRLRRQNQMIIEQKHIKNEDTEGYIKTPYGEISTRIKTSELTFEGDQTLNLKYELWIADEYSGEFGLEIEVKE